MGWEARGNNPVGVARCDRCGLELENPYWTYPTGGARGSFCQENGWASHNKRLLCGSCWEETLPEFPSWAMVGRLIVAIEPWCDHPVGTRAVVTKLTETHGPSGERYRIIVIRPAAPSEARWCGNLWLDRDAHLKWTPVKGPSRWAVIGAMP